MPSSTMEDETGARCGPTPRGEKRRREIAIVAERVFFEYGFTDATMQTIAAKAGASKETLYRHFGSKEGLFSEIIQNRANHFLEGLDENLKRPGVVGDLLQILGTRMLTAMMDRDVLSLYRLMIAEGARNPELGRIFYEQGPERVRGRLTAFLKAAVARGDLTTCPNPALAATVFLGAVVAMFPLKGVVCPDCVRLTKAEIKVHIDETVALFLCRYRA